MTEVNDWEYWVGIHPWWYYFCAGLILGFGAGFIIAQVIKR